MDKRAVYRFAVLAACALATVSGHFNYPASKPNDQWWSNTIIYQVYPRSFKDSNKDGIGDLKGIVQKLDYFVELGVDTLWIGPLFKSPMTDMGYDVEDYRTIDPIFGTMDDFDELIVEMNKRNLKLITDLIPNHSSYMCEWFQKSIKREGRYKDYYVWLDAKNQDEVVANSSVTPIVPNNWVSIFGGTAWTWNTERKQFFYHQFNSRQPDFNIRNPAIHQELYDILEFWMDKGISGFRFDALKHLYESEFFFDEPYVKGKEGSDKFNDMKHIYTVDQPEVIDIIYKWREFLDNYTQKHQLANSKIMTTESYSSIETLMKYYGNSTKPGAQIPFNFGLFGIVRDNVVESMDKHIKSWLDNLPENAVPNWVMENHDNSRIPARYGAESVPLFIALKLALPGVEVTYYGSEIGMDNSFVRPDQRQDPNNVGDSRATMTRDGERCPMQWDDSTNAGFTEVKSTWLPVNPDYYKVNVAAQRNVSNSNLNVYKKMARLRKTNTFRYGGVQSYNITRSIYVLRRSLADHESYFVVTNFGSETETVVLSNVIGDLGDKLYVCIGSENTPYREGNVVSTTTATDSGLILQLRPQSVVVLTDKAIIDTVVASTANRGRTVSQSVGLSCVVLLARRFLRADFQ